MTTIPRDWLRSCLSHVTAKGPNPSMCTALKAPNPTTENLSPKDVGELATRAKVKTVILTHLTPKFNSDDYTAEALEVRKHYSGPVIVAQDLDTFF